VVGNVPNAPISKWQQAFSGMCVGAVEGQQVLWAVSGVHMAVDTVCTL